MELSLSSSCSCVKSHSELLEENLNLRRENEILKSKLKNLESIFKEQKVLDASKEDHHV